jgi:hypothetical protein
MKGQAEISGRGRKTEEWKEKKGKFKDVHRGTEKLKMNERAERGIEKKKIKGQPTLQSHCQTSWTWTVGGHHLSKSACAARRV